MRYSLKSFKTLKSEGMLNVCFIDLNGLNGFNL